MKLFYSPGACSLATHIVLRELGLEFDLDKTDTASGRTESGLSFRTINPLGYVPALETVDGDVITENVAILQFLADRRPDRKLAPAHGTLARTRLHELLNFLSSELHKAYGPFFSGKELDADSRAAVEEKLARRVGAVEDRLADGRDYLLGETFGVADAYAFVLLNWSYGVGFDLSPWPRVERFVARVKARPTVHNAMLAEGLIGQKAVA